MFPISEDIEVRVDCEFLDVDAGRVPAKDRPVARKFQGRFLLAHVNARHQDYLDFEHR